MDLRLNILNEKVDTFVIAEATKDHTGKEKKLNFDINNFKKFKDKIINHVVEDIPKEVKNYKKGWSPNFYRENFHRDSISKAIENCDPEDLILISQDGKYAANQEKATSIPKEANPLAKNAASLIETKNQTTIDELCLNQNLPSIYASFPEVLRK